jgi:hypothetical protein
MNIHKKIPMFQVMDIGRCRHQEQLIPKICKRENCVEYQVVEYCHFFKKYHALSIVIGCDEIVVSTIQHRRHVI